VWDGGNDETSSVQHGIVAVVVERKELLAQIMPNVPYLAVMKRVICTH